MHPALEKLVQSASDTGTLAQNLASSGIKHLEATFARFGLVASVEALEAQEEALAQDETHYVLVPHGDQEVTYAVFSKRVIPQGYGANNELPKARIFHLPDVTAQEILEQELIEQAKAMHLDGVDTNSEFADKLDAFAEAIDRETNKLSGGLLIIGGAVALLNPLVGVGIAAQGLLPSLGVKASKMGANTVGDKLRERNQNRAESGAEKSARLEVRKLKPEIFVNPILKSLDVILTNPNPDFDPFLDDAASVTAFTRQHDFQVTLEAVTEVYAEDLKRAKPREHSKLRQVDLDWLRHLSELRGEGCR